MSGPGTEEDLPAIRVRHLVRQFGSVTAVAGVSFDVMRGEIFGLLGHNGAGKTTTIRLLNGVLVPTSGSVTVFGMDPVEDGWTLRRRTGVLTSTPALDEPLTPRENLRTYGAIYGVEPARLEARIDELVDLFEMSTYADEPARGLSSGMRQRVALSRALVHDPDIIFLDEPTSAIDPIAARRVRDAIAMLNRERGRTVVICTHNLPEAQQLCDRLAIIERGRILGMGSLDELARELRVRPVLRVDVGTTGVDAVAAALVDRAEVTEVPSAGDLVDVHFRVRAEIPTIITVLVGAGIPVYEAKEVVADLEDVYLAIHERRLGSEEEEPWTVAR